MDRIIEILARELGKDPRHVENVVRLLDEGSTVPFIARYRKELHGAMDDTALRTLEERLSYLRGLAERREAVKKAIEGQGKLTEELAAAIDAAGTLAEVEDLYRPYKQKRRTRATIARERGLAPLAEVLFAQGADCPVPEEEAAKYIDPEKGVETVRTPSPGRPTSSRRPSVMTRPSGGSSGPFWGGAGISRPPPSRRRTPSTGSTMTSASPSPGSRATRCWPSTGGRRRAS